MLDSSCRPLKQSLLLDLLKVGSPVPRFTKEVFILNPLHAPPTLPHPTPPTFYHRHPLGEQNARPSPSAVYCSTC